MKLSPSWLIKTAGIAIAVVGVVSSSATLAEIKPNSGSQPTSVIAQANSLGNIVEVASRHRNLKTLVKAIQAAGLVDTLTASGSSFTVFAPTDAAFKKLPRGVLKKLLQPENQDTLAKILKYHVIPSEVDAKDIQPGDLTTVEGSSIQITVVKNKVHINKARVEKADVKASNGVIHIINQVLIPPDVQL